MDLRSEVIYTPRTSPAARNRFLHVQGLGLGLGLQPLPSSFLSLFTLPLGRLVLRTVLAEPFIPANGPRSSSPIPSPPSDAPTTTNRAEADDDVDVDVDESVDSFFSRRFGDAFARTLGSALIHGIYAADSRRLSLLATFPQLRASETRGNGSVIWGELGPPAWWWMNAFNNNAKSQSQEEEEKWEGIREWETRFGRTAALFSFKEGMETLVRALVEALRRFPNVVLWNGTAVHRIGIDTADDGERCSFDVCVSFFLFLARLWC